MADSTNFGWPLPDPQGIQQTEIARIATALGLADGKAKALADLIAALTFASIGGIIANAQLPNRLAPVQSGKEIADWNLAVESGWYRGSGALNAPPDLTGWAFGYVEGSSSAPYATQTVYDFTASGAGDTKAYRRSVRGGAWENWYRLRWSETEIQAMIDATVSAAVNGLLDAAPGTLDTLNELAAAIGDDPNFAATISAQIGSKLPAASYTAADVLAKVKSLDGPASGLSVTQADNADKLGGQNGAYYRNLANSTGEIADANLPDRLQAYFPVTADCNSLTSSGFYFVNQGSANKPEVNFGYLLVIGLDAAGRCIQIWRGYNSNTAFQRQNNPAGTWSAWESIRSDKSYLDATYLGINATAAKASTLASGGGDGAAITFTWAGVGGTPAYVFGGSSPADIRVYNPANFSVAFAADAGKLEGLDGAFYRNAGNLNAGTVPSARLVGTYAINITGNAGSLDGINSSGFARLYTGGGANDTVFPLGHMVLVHDSPAYNRNAVIPVCLAAGASGHYATTGTACAGTWRQRGAFIINSNYYQLAQRVA